MDQGHGLAFFNRLPPQTPPIDDTEEDDDLVKIMEGARILITGGVGLSEDETQKRRDLGLQVQMQNVNKTDERRFLKACRLGQQDIVELLAYNHKGARDRYGASALHIATQNGHLNIVRRLVQYGADVNAATKTGTALHTACVQKQCAIAEVLLTSGVLPDTQAHIDGSTALHHAVTGGSSVLVALLLQHNANTTIRNAKGMTPSKSAMAIYVARGGRGVICATLLRILQLLETQAVKRRQTRRGVFHTHLLEGATTTPLLLSNIPSVGDVLCIEDQPRRGSVRIGAAVGRGDVRASLGRGGGGVLPEGVRRLASLPRLAPTLPTLKNPPA